MRSHGYAGVVPKTVDHGERRTAIAIGVITVMAEHGIAGVSLRTVAHAAGVSMGSVQHYFATKADLVHHACQMIIDRATEQHVATQRAPAGERIRHLLTMGIPGTPQQRTGTAIWHEFVIAGANDATIAEMITSAWQERRRILVELLDDLDAGSSLPSADLADLLAATSDGLAVRATLGDLTRQEACAKLQAQLAAFDVPERDRTHG